MMCGIAAKSHQSGDDRLLFSFAAAL